MDLFIYCNKKDRILFFLSVKIFENDCVFIQGFIESDLGEPIWLGRIVPNTICDQFQKNIVGS